MEQLTSGPASALGDAGVMSAIGESRSADHWQRRFGVPWDRVDRAARAVLERAAAASKRRFAELNSADLSAGAYPG